MCRKIEQNKGDREEVLSHTKFEEPRASLLEFQTIKPTREAHENQAGKEKQKSRCRAFIFLPLTRKKSAQMKWRNGCVWMGWFGEALAYITIPSERAFLFNLKWKGIFLFYLKCKSHSLQIQVDKPIREITYSIREVCLSSVYFCSCILSV